MNCKGVCLSLLCVALLFSFSDGACKKEFASYRLDKARKSITFFCSHRGMDWSHGLMRFDAFCEECYCFGFSMECCESADVSGVIAVEGCEKEIRGCRAVFYKFDKGIKIDCLTGRPFHGRPGF
ncbi:uncharacterized protein LOC125681319 [Ostrea edulis]|uniref:uncharacterized protein LOC125681319 n=1 Tax=Ostrea edulis TaxID=37623 RepID=UPI0020946D3F|nr:uncharacterized protein LOC125681319 [Ostrea edulis]